MIKNFLLQKRAIRIITKSDFRSSTDPLFAELNILPIHDLIKLHTLLSMFKLQNEKYPSIPGICFINNNIIHSHSTRQRNDIRLPRNRTTTANNSFYTAGIKEWNKLDINIKNSSTLSRFKCLLKQALIRNLTPKDVVKCNCVVFFLYFNYKLI